MKIDKKKFVFIPGKKSTLITNERLKGLFSKNTPKIFDYRSISNLDDTMRLVWDTVGWKPSDAVKRLTIFLDEEKPTHIIAHSHGSQLLHHALLLVKHETLDRIQGIRTFGARKPISIPNMDVLNVYNEKDWVFHLIIRLGFIPKEIASLPRNKVVDYNSVKYKIISTEKVVKSIDITHKNHDEFYEPDEQLFYCTNSTHAHKIPCYFEEIVSYMNSTNNKTNNKTNKTKTNKTNKTKTNKTKKTKTKKHKKKIKQNKKLKQKKTKKQKIK